jgi:predicted dehydrogenase
VAVGWKDSRYRQISGRDWVIFGKGYDKIQAFRSQIGNFARAIRGDERLRITAEDAVASVEVIEAAYQSLRQPHWQNVRPAPVEVPAEVAIRKNGATLALPGAS